MVSRQEVAERIWQLSNSQKDIDWSKSNNFPLLLIRLGVRYQLLVGQEVVGDAVFDSYSSGLIPQGIDRSTSRVFADKLFDSIAEFPITLMSLDLLEKDKLNQRQLVLRQLARRSYQTAFRTSKNNFYSQAKEFCWLGAAMFDLQERVNQKQEQARDISRFLGLNSIINQNHG